MTYHLVPGDSEIDQLYLIQEGVGKPLPSKLKAFFKGNKKYKGLHLPNEDYYTRDSEYTHSIPKFKDTSKFSILFSFRSQIDLIVLAYGTK